MNLSKIQNQLIFSAVCYVILLACLFLPTVWWNDYDPQGKSEADLIVVIIYGYQNVVLFGNIIIITLIRFLPILGKKGEFNVLLIVFTIVYILMNCIYSFSIGIGVGANGQFPSHEGIGFYLLLLSSFTLLIQSHIIYWNKR